MNEKVKALKETLAELEERVSTYDETAIKHVLDTAALFHDYSFHNSLLIKAQCAGAKKVAGFQTWKRKFQRHVTKGEHGLGILAPTFFPKPKDKDAKPDDKPQMINYFRIVYVFDVSQTEGQPLPKDFETTPQQKVQLVKNIKNLIKQDKIPYKELDLTKYNDTNLSTFDTNDGNTFSALIHDYAHHLLHTRDIAMIEKLRLSDMDKKVEAETVVYLVCKNFDVVHNSAKHIALWSDRKNPFKQLHRISKVAAEITGKIKLNKLVGGNN